MDGASGHFVIRIYHRPDWIRGFRPPLTRPTWPEASPSTNDKILLRLILCEYLDLLLILGHISTHLQILINNLIYRYSLTRYTTAYISSFSQQSNNNNIPFTHCVGGGWWMDEPHMRQLTSHFGNGNQPNE